jgi:hypothetical protein
VQGEINIRDKRLLLAYLLAGISSVFWIVIFIRHSVTNILLMWIPLGAPVCVLLVLFVNNDFNTVLADVNGLAAAKYDFKKL